MAAGKQKKSLSRAPEVLNLAAKLFYEQGYDATSVQDIADALGIQKGSLYYYIDTKEDLLFAIVNEAHDASEENVRKARALETDLMTRIRRFLSDHVDILIGQQIKFGVYLRDFRSLNTKRRAQVARRRHEYSSYLQELIAEGQDTGLFAADLMPHLAAFGILGMLNWIYEWYRPDGYLTGQEIRDGLVESAIRCLLPRQDAHAPSLSARSNL